MNDLISLEGAPADYAALLKYSRISD
jgi:hypothetical protein